MSNPYASFIPQSRSFLRELRANNTRDWFLANKSTYDTQLKRPAEFLLDDVAIRLNKLTGLPCKPKLFRPHRDVRFSKDKTPYHTHLHMLWTTTDAEATVGWYFGISPDYVKLGGGIMGLTGPQLTRWRNGVDSAAGETLAAQVSVAQTAGFTLNEPDLKRVPAPFAPTHPRADLLRAKSFGLWRDAAPDPSDLPTDILTGFTALWPAQRTLLGLLNS